MTMSHTELQLVPIELVSIHEGHEPARLACTRQAIAADNLLRHPLLATPMADGRYLILDGAHRTQSLRELGCRRVPVQVIGPEAFTLEAWSHLVPVGPWLDELMNDPRLRWGPGEDTGCKVAEMVDARGAVHHAYAAGAGETLLAALPTWHRVVAAYTQEHSVLRMPAGVLESPEPGKVLLRYPTCTLREVESVVAAGQVFPPGVTRFVVEGRFLNLRIPLRLLTSPTYSAAEWETFVLKCRRALRFYAEGVYLCEA